MSSLTRIAPTPSGYLHLGNAASFLLTARIAQREGCRILLRIDDLDSDRKRPEYVQDIFDTLHWLGIEWQQGPKDREEFERSGSQRHRMPLYEQLRDTLISTGKVYACSCSRSSLPPGPYPGTCRDRNLPLDSPDTALRLRTDPGTVMQWKEIDGATCGASLDLETGDFIIWRRYGLPAYQLASVADDIHFGVDLIVRGADLIPSTAMQRYLAKVAGLDAFLQARLLHHPLLRDASGRKLSKSEGADSLKAMREAGVTADEIIRRVGNTIGR